MPVRLFCLDTSVEELRYVVVSNRVRQIPRGNAIPVLQMLIGTSGKEYFYDVTSPSRLEDSLTERRVSVGVRGIDDCIVRDQEFDDSGSEFCGSDVQGTPSLVIVSVDVRSAGDEICRHSFIAVSSRVPEGRTTVLVTFVDVRSVGQ